MAKSSERKTAIYAQNATAPPPIDAAESRRVEG
jgi:hypothetical protein